jgi:hypothetical protein
MVLLMDDVGTDSWQIDLAGGVEFGAKALNEGGLPNAPTNRSLAYFLDGRGVDTYRAIATCCDPLTFGEGLVRVDGRPDSRWGVFVDCESGSDDVLPCEAQQGDVLLRMAETAAP